MPDAEAAAFELEQSFDALVRMRCCEIWIGATPKLSELVLLCGTLHSQAYWEMLLIDRRQGTISRRSGYLPMDSRIASQVLQVIVHPWPCYIPVTRTCPATNRVSLISGQLMQVLTSRVKVFELPAGTSRQIPTRPLAFS